jgi:ACT domain-containing protein
VERIKYQDLVTRYGDAAAYDLLLSVEKLAKINSDIIRFEEEERFQKALEALNEINFAPHLVEDVG